MNFSWNAMVGTRVCIMSHTSIYIHYNMLKNTPLILRWHRVPTHPSQENRAFPTCQLWKHRTHLWKKLTHDIQIVTNLLNRNPAVISTIISLNLRGIKFSVRCSLTLWCITIPIVVVPHRQPLNVALYIFIQQIQVLNILNTAYTLRFFFLFKMQFVS